MYRIKEAGDYLGVSSQTLRRWEKEGKLIPTRTKGGHRRYKKSVLKEVLGEGSKEEREILGYCRVSTITQKEDLERQVENVGKYCIAKGYTFRIIKDIGSGLNYKKRGLRELIQLVSEGKVERLILNYKDRLVRFGYEIIEQICELHGTEIEIINKTEDVTFEEELVQDVLAIITVFSARMYGSRSHKAKKVVKELEEKIRGV